MCHFVLKDENFRKLNMAQSDFDTAIQLNHDAYSDAIGAPKVMYFF